VKVLRSSYKRSQADDKAAGDTARRDVVIDDHQMAMPHRAFNSARSGFNISRTASSCRRH
jgi:hypothetical protein